MTEPSRQSAARRLDLLARAIIAAAPRAEPHTCKRGHLVSGANLYVDPAGRRRCRACARERLAERKQPTKETP